MSVAIVGLPLGIGRSARDTVLVRQDLAHGKGLRTEGSARERPHQRGAARHRLLGVERTSRRRAAKGGADGIDERGHPAASADELDRVDLLEGDPSLLDGPRAALAHRDEHRTRKTLESLARALATHVSLTD